MFEYKEQIICFVNWIKDGILYVKGIFNENRETYDISYFMNLLRKRNNILCEYVMLKQVVKECIKVFNFSNAKHVIIFFCLKTICSCLFILWKAIFFCYSTLVKTKFLYPLYESMLETLFDLETVDFNCEKFYTSKIKQLYKNNITEFNYKLLHCIVNNNLAVSKWNENVSPLCDVCKLVEDTQHLS